MPLSKKNNVEESTSKTEGTITINKEKYDDAVVKALDKITDDPDLKGSGALAIFLSSTLFASELRNILFSDVKEMDK